MTRGGWRVAVLLAGAVVLLVRAGFGAAPGLESTQGLPYRDFTTTSAPRMMLSQVQTFQAGNLPDLKSRKALMAEVAALMGVVRRYDFRASPHRTDGRSNFIAAEWPLMTMVYTGLALCNLAETFPEEKPVAEKEIRFLLTHLKTPAVADFMEPHFGKPFPADGRIGQAAVFVHGHFLYLALRFRQVFGRPDADLWIHRVAECLARDFDRAIILPSYRGMYFISDNGTGLAALALYDRLFGTRRGVGPLANFIREVTANYLDDFGLMATYVDLAGKRLEVPARGISSMYSLLFLADAAPGFARTQWDLARKHLISRLSDVVSRNADAIPMGQVLSYLVSPYLVCLEHPVRPHGSASARDQADTDSGPVVFGVGTSATGFAIGAAYANDDPATGAAIEDLALIFGDPWWNRDKLWYRNMFHPVGQAVVLYGKTIGLVKRKAAPAPTDPTGR